MDEKADELEVDAPSWRWTRRAGDEEASIAEEEEAVGVGVEAAEEEAVSIE